MHKTRRFAFFKAMILLAATLVYFLLSNDLYWCICVLLIFSANEIKKDELFRLTSTLLIIGVLLVLFLCMIGILPDILTSRTQDTADSYVRHSWGFYHSNVLPLCVLYLQFYYIFVKENLAKVWVVSVLCFLEIVLYFCSDSRNSFYLSLVLTISFLCFKGFKILRESEFLSKILYFTVKYITLFAFGFSIAMLFLLLKGGVWDSIDYLFSGRFRLGIFKMREIGLHAINFIDNEKYFSDSIVLDNGYLYVIFRYGLVFSLIYIVLYFFLASKEKGKIYSLLVLLLVALCNFIDNDLVDYSFLPFILFGFSNYKVKLSQIIGDKRSGGK